MIYITILLASSLLTLVLAGQGYGGPFPVSRVSTGKAYLVTPKLRDWDGQFNIWSYAYKSETSSIFELWSGSYGIPGYPLGLNSLELCRFSSPKCGRDRVWRSKSDPAYEPREEDGESTFEGVVKIKFDLMDDCEVFSSIFNGLRCLRQSGMRLVRIRKNIGISSMI
jgi:hypothetical protein